MKYNYINLYYENGDLVSEDTRKSFNLKPGRYYFEENRFHINNFSVVDAADANNIYLWIKL